MLLYHASSVEIRDPDIRRGRKNADLGQGFYLTPDRGFACRWSPKGGFINEYELDLSGLVVHRLSRNSEWSEYIFGNRRTIDALNCDVVIAPIANDIIYDTLGILSSDILSPEERTRLLMIGPEYVQVAIKSDKAREHLSFLRAEKVEGAENWQKLRKEEEAEYQMVLAQELSRTLGPKE